VIRGKRSQVKEESKKKLSHSKSKKKSNYAKLRIHYSKEKYSEIKVFENSNPDTVATDFCKKGGSHIVLSSRFKLY
jgi:hypothetical protein